MRFVFFIMLASILSASPKMLGTTFADAGLKETPPSFVVEAVAPKPKTFVKAGDRVLAMNGKKLVEKSDFIRTGFYANKMGQLSQHLKVERSGKALEALEALEVLEVDEPMTELEHGYINSGDLEKLQAD